MRAGPIYLPHVSAKPASPGAVLQLRQPRVAMLEQSAALCAPGLQLNALSWPLPSDAAADADMGDAASC